MQCHARKFFISQTQKLLSIKTPLFFFHFLFKTKSGCESTVEAALKGVDGVVNARCPFMTRQKSICTTEIQDFVEDSKMLEALAEMGMSGI